MLFVTFWKMANNVETSKVAEAAKKLFEQGKYPAKGVKVHYWLMTPGGKGIVISEADDIEAIFKNWMVWTKEYPGIFESHEIHPALDVPKIAELALKE